MARTASERGGRAGQLQGMCGCCLGQGAGQGDTSRTRAHPGVPWPPEGWLHTSPRPADTAPAAAALCPSCPAGSGLAQPPGGQAPGAGPEGFGPRLSHCVVFGGGTRLTVLSKWLSALPQPVSPSAFSGKSLLLLWGRLPLCAPGLKGRSPPFSVGRGWEAGWSWGNQQEPPESYRPMGPIQALGLGFGPGMQGLVPFCGADAGVRARG